MDDLTSALKSVATKTDEFSAKLQPLLSTLQNAVKMAPLPSVILMLQSAADVVEKLRVEERSECKFTGQFLSCYIQCVAQCASKIRSDKSLNTETIRNIIKYLIIALRIDVLVCAKAAMSSDKFLSLLTYLVEVCWTILPRTTEICKSNKGDKGGVRSDDCNLMDALILVHGEYLMLSCAKGIEMSTRCFLKSSDLKETSQSWDSYLQHILGESPEKNEKNIPEKIISLQEMQSIILWRSEISTASKTLFLSDGDITEKWEELLPVITKECSSVCSAECSSHGMWNILYGIVTMEIQLRNQIRNSNLDIPSSKDTKESKNPSKDKKYVEIKENKENLHNLHNNVNIIVFLTSALNDLNLEKIDSMGLELLSEAVCLAVQVEVCEGNMENVSGNDGKLNSINSIISNVKSGTSSNSSGSIETYSSPSVLLIEQISALCTLICNPLHTPETPKTPQEMSKYGTFLARSYSSCLKYLQNHFQNGIKERNHTGDIEHTPQAPYTPHTPHNAQRLASNLFKIIFNSLKTPSVWNNNGPAVLQTLRALGNCLSHLPLGSSEGFLGVNLCSVLGDSVVHLIGCEISQDILTTCLTLVSLVGGRCMSSKLYIASSQLLTYTLVAVDLLVINKKLRIIEQNSTESSTSPDPHSFPLAFTVEATVMNRLLASLTTACAISSTVDDISNNSNCDDTSIGPTIFDVCSPILTSTYGTDFLYGLCGEILLRVGDTRPSNITPCSTTSTADNALHLIIRIFQIASDSGVVPAKECRLMMLYAQSHCLWSVPVPSDDDSSDDVIKSLRALKEGAVGGGDTRVVEAAIAKGKGKSKKGKADDDTSSSTTSVPPILSAKTLSLHAISLRRWMLLALWGLPLNTAQVDVFAFDGSNGLFDYLTNALDALRSLAKCTRDLKFQDPPLESSSSSARFSLSGDCKTLFHMLGLSGRLKEQAEASMCLQQCKDLFTHAPTAARKEYNQIAQEILFLNEIYAVWSGDGTTSTHSSIIPSAQSSAHTSNGSSSSSSTCSSSTSSLSSNRSSIGLVTTTYSSIEDGGNADIRAVWGFLDLSRNLLGGAFTGPRNNERKGDNGCPGNNGYRGELEALAEALLTNSTTSSSSSSLTSTSSTTSPTPSSTSSSSSSSSTSSQASSSSPLTSSVTTPPSVMDGFSLPLSASLKAWVSLLTAKAILCYGGDHQNSYHWVRRALPYVATRTLSDRLKMRSSMRGSMSVDRCLPRLEGILLSADLYEQTGNTDSCLAYIAEATAIAKSSSQAARSIVSLHSIRIWDRLNSAKFISALLHLSGTGPEEHLIVTSKDDDDVSMRVREVSKGLVKLLKIEDLDNEEIGNDDRVSGRESDRIGGRGYGGSGSKGKDRRHPDTGGDYNGGDYLLLSYRHLNTAWDLRPDSKRFNSSNHPTSYHTNMAAADRDLLSEGDKGGKMSLYAASQQLLSNLKDSSSFDILRDVRRTACMHSLSADITHIPYIPSSVTSNNGPNNDSNIPLNNGLNNGSNFPSRNGAKTMRDGDRKDSDKKDGDKDGVRCHGVMENNSFYSFILGASSCSTAMECIMERRTGSTADNTSRNDTHTTHTTHSANTAHTDSLTHQKQTVPTGISELSAAIKSACCNDTIALHAIQSILKCNVRFSTAGGDAVCFVVVEPITGNLLLGRWDAEHSSVVCLPVADDLNSLLNQWTVCMEESKALLHRTSDTTEVMKWTDADKRAWWSDRMASDVLIETILSKLEDLLSPSLSILIGVAGETGGLIGDIYTDNAMDLGSDSRISSDMEKDISKAGNKLKKSVKKETTVDTWADNDDETLGNMQASFSALNIKKATSKTTDLKAKKITPTNANTTSNISPTYEELNLLTVPKLKKILTDKKLPIIGVKKDLIDTLMKHDLSINHDVSHLSSLSRIYEDIPNTPIRICVDEDPISLSVRSADPPPTGPKNNKKSDPKGVTSMRKPNRDNGDGDGDDCVESDVRVENIDKSNKCDKLKPHHIEIIPPMGDKNDKNKSRLSSPILTQNTHNSSHTILILDEKLQHIPWEALPALKGRQCSRIPSFALMLHMLTRDTVKNVQKDANYENVEKEENSEDSKNGDNDKEQTDKHTHKDRKKDSKIKTADSTHSRKTESESQTSHSHHNSHHSHNINLKRTWYALDPEGNLPATRETMSSFLRPYIDSYSWPGYAGEMPTEDTAKNLHNNSDLFIYCGHGAGEKMCDSYKMRKWNCPSAMLWGCSSGRLSIPGVHDPQGPALNYLIGGANYVLANLWDVTDKDIDKLSMECMRIFFQDSIAEHSSTTSETEIGIKNEIKSESKSEARRVAKMDTESSTITDNANKATKEIRGDKDIRGGNCSVSLPPVSLPSVSLSKALAASRGICKLKNAVGCAPVVYGMPEKLI